MFFIETPAFSRRYVYLGGYVLGKLQRSGGGTFIWGGYVYLALDSTQLQLCILTSVLRGTLRKGMEFFLISDNIGYANIFHNSFTIKTKII